MRSSTKACLTTHQSASVAYRKIQRRACSDRRGRAHDRKCRLAAAGRSIDRTVALPIARQSVQNIGHAWPASRDRYATDESEKSWHSLRCSFAQQWGLLRLPGAIEIMRLFRLIWFRKSHCQRFFTVSRENCYRYSNANAPFIVSGRLFDQKVHGWPGSDQGFRCDLPKHVFSFLKIL